MTVVTDLPNICTDCGKFITLPIYELCKYAKFDNHPFITRKQLKEFIDKGVFGIQYCPHQNCKHWQMAWNIKEHTPIEVEKEE